MTGAPGEGRGEAKCREILEVGPEATMEEIRRAHAFLKALYAPDGSGDPAPSMDEFAPHIRARILCEVEEAYQELCGLEEAAQPPPPPVRPAPPDPDQILDGPALGRLREAAGFSLERLGAETNVRPQYLEALEDERFADLPSPPVVVRGYLTAYLAALGLEAGATVGDYVNRFQRWQARRP
jgi:hypothetical protein